MYECTTRFLLHVIFNFQFFLLFFYMQAELRKGLKGRKQAATAIDVSFPAFTTE
jgi:hypothetical protein